MRRWPALVALLALGTTVGCTVSQMFDRWDNELQTGQDSEFAYVVIALCLAVVILLVQRIPAIACVLATAIVSLLCDSSSFWRASVGVSEVMAVSLARPPTSSVLRI